MADHENPSEPEPDQPAPVIPYSSPTQSPRLVRVRQFPSEMEANLAAMKLEAEGIHPQLAGQARQAGLGTYGAASPGVDLLVSDTEAEAAGKILDAVEALRAKHQTAHDARLRCPRCGADNTVSGDRRRIRIGITLSVIGIVATGALIFGQSFSFDLPGWILAFILLAGLGFYFLISGQSRRTCPQCGHSWIPPRDDLEDE